MSDPSVTAATTARVVVADDQPLMRRAMAELLDSEPGFEVVGQAADGAEALELVRELEPDLLLCDLQMPQVTGVEVIRELSGTSTVRCLALTTFTTSEWVLAALRAGASGYLIKDASPEEVINAVHAVLADTMIVSPAVVSLLVEHVNTVSGTGASTATPTPTGPGQTEPEPDVPGETAPSDDDAPDLQLSPRESEVLELLAGGLNNREIADELFLSEGSVKMHIGKACDRLQARDRVQLLVRAVEFGLVSPALLRPETAQDRFR